MTRRENEIVDLMRNEGVAVSTKDLENHFNWHQSTARTYLNRLVSKGYIKWVWAEKGNKKLYSLIKQ